MVMFKVFRAAPLSNPGRCCNISQRVIIAVVVSWNQRRILIDDLSLNAMTSLMLLELKVEGVVEV